jgi:hypothetical protein
MEGKMLVPFPAVNAQINRFGKWEVVSFQVNLMALTGIGKTSFFFNASDFFGIKINYKQNII